MDNHAIELLNETCESLIETSSDNVSDIGVIFGLTILCLVLLLLLTVVVMV